MNYYVIKNRYEVVKYNYPDIFKIDIYYLDDYYCQINVKRLDSNDGWGLNLQFNIYDELDENNYDLITFGKSDENFNSNIFKTNIKLLFNENIQLEIPNYILPRKDFLINNKYDLIYDNNIFIDIHLVIYYVNNYEIKIIMRRLDEEFGWDNDFKIILYDNDFKYRKQIINLGLSDKNYKYIFKKTKIKINYQHHDYFQEIPKTIFQTGSNNFKNILHFNSIISFIELNPEYTYIYYNDVNSRNFLRQNFSEEINYCYDTLVPGAYKADLLRYCLLYNQGGCYFDCKQILKIPIKLFLEKDTTILLCNDVIQKALLNAVIFSVKKNIIIEKTLKDCVYNIIHKLGNNALDITGPTFFYKSISKYITDENLILQNNRPPNNFNDFSNDYFNNVITHRKTKNIILNRFYKNYYNDYLETNHYGKLYEINEIYYKNFQNLHNFRICVYPNSFNDKFLFNYDKNRYILNVKRTDSKDGWYFNLKILIITKDYNELLINVGNSKKNDKNIDLKINID